MYEHADTGWRNQPGVMADETVERAAERIGEHAAAHRSPAVGVVFHGGEPLLAGRAKLARAATALRAALPAGCALDLRIHTNGVVLDERWAELFLDHEIKVGLSLDGDRTANDRHRRFANGRSSHPHVVRAIDLLRAERYRSLFSGLLCTIDVANDPIVVYEALLSHEPPALEFLFPHATWETPPAASAGNAPEYARWLGRIFDRWTADGRPVPIRLFDSIVRTTAGLSSLTEAIGLQDADLLVIETDGSLEQADSLKTAFDGAAATGLSVFADSFDVAARHPGITARQGGLDALCAECRACPVVDSCGGGLYAHRYRRGSGFANPSVYCADLKELIRIVRDRVPTGPRFHLPEADFAALAGGVGGEHAVRSLAEGQRGFRRGLLARAYWHLVAVAGIDSEAWDLLDRVDREDGGILDRLLAHPYLTAWAGRCLSGAGPAEVAYLTGLAIAAAHEAGVEVDLRVTVGSDGALSVPTVGRLETGRAGAELTVEVGEKGLAVRGPGETWHIVGGDLEPGSDAAAWHPVRHLHAGDISVALDDVDPYRDYSPLRARPYLAAAEALEWQDRFGRAWDIVRREYADYAPGIRAGLVAITPLEPDPGGRSVSGTARTGFGAIGVALPSEPAQLALLLLHEFQHVKMGALLDLLDLLHPMADPPRFTVAWRPDPRPVEGVLQGAYAHLAVADFWRRRAGAGPEGQAARRKFDSHRADTADAVAVLAGSGALTTRGLQVAAAMQDTLDSW
ncbi:FxsB family cyclophane-forming radical SAM/SPASM peptide maturase [Cryptosporangium japonicum]|uniref:FxsB family cyclophane-forming radical SAM/SPASM peptide maturase n=1 Tax=Cryptosporangium japonicum TaxID=80872 RepID=UPI003CD09F57